VFQAVTLPLSYSSVAEDVRFELTGLSPSSFQDYRTNPLCESSLQSVLPAPGRGVGHGREYEIRTHEAVTPTNFPDWLHKPLGELSMAETVGVEPTEAVNLSDLANRRTRPLCEVSLAERTGFEPVNSCVTGKCRRPLG
jgi:hypothetical protein